MFKISKKIVIISSLAVLAVGGLITYQVKRSAVVYETAKVSRGPITAVVSVTGSIAPVSKIALQPEVSGRIVKIAVKEGDRVKAGNLIVQLDSRDVESRIASQQAAVASAQAQLDQLVAGATPEELRVAATAVDTAQAQLTSATSAQNDAVTAVTNAQKSLANAQNQADIALQGKVDVFLNDDSDAVTVANDAINRLTSALFDSRDLLSFISSDSQAELDAVNSRGEAKAALLGMTATVATASASGTADAADAADATVLAGLQTVKRHADADAVVLTSATNLSTTTFASYQANVSAAQINVNLAIQKITADKSSLDLQKRLNATEITGAEIALDTAMAGQTAAGHAVETVRRALDQAQAAYDLKKIGTRPEAIAAARAQVAVQQAALVGFRTDLSKRFLTAPIDAIVTDIPVELGETISPAATVATLNALDRFEIISNISEVDIAKIAVGQVVDITLDAFNTGEKWTGKVISIQPAEKVVEGVIFYQTKIVFDQDDPRLKSGMTANLDIETDRQDGVLLAPLQALQETGGQKYVYVLENGKPVKREVVTGLEDNQSFEAKSGLSEGESVITSPVKNGN